MSDNASILKAGTFVWSHFPYSDDPFVPGPLHVGYVLLVEMTPDTDRPPLALIAYTTPSPSRIEKSRRRPMPGHFLFSQDEARSAGQTPRRGDGFLLDLHTAAFVPVTSQWIPNLQHRDGPEIGGVTPDQRREIDFAFVRIAEGKSIRLLRQRADPEPSVGPDPTSAGAGSAGPPVFRGPRLLFTALQQQAPPTVAALSPPDMPPPGRIPFSPTSRGAVPLKAKAGRHGH